MMKKIAVDFENYLSPTMIKAIAMMYKNGFRDSDVISFSEIDVELEDRIKVFFNDTLFLINKSVVDDALNGKYDEEILIPPKDEGEICEGDYCEG